MYTTLRPRVRVKRHPHLSHCFVIKENVGDQYPMFITWPDLYRGLDTAVKELERKGVKHYEVDMR